MYDMKQRLSYFLGQDGYLKLKTSLPEFSVFFKTESDFINMVLLLDMEENPYVTQDTLISVRNKVRWKFIDQGHDEIHVLIIAISSDVHKAALLGEKEVFYWVINQQENQLFIPDGHAEDFYGMKGNIQQWLREEFDENAAGSRNEVYHADGRQIKGLKDQPFVNHIIFVVNMIVFTLCILTGELLYDYGRLSYPDVAGGEWYRILTSLFLHANITHISGNMIMLFLLGAVVEKEMGHFKYFVLYFGSGIAAAFASLYLQSVRISRGELFLGSIGASGAIFGIMGGFLWILLLNRGRASNMSFVRVLFLVCYCLFGGLREERIDNAAHFGGLLAGILISVLIYRKKKPKKEAAADEN